MQPESERVRGEKVREQKIFKSVWEGKEAKGNTD